MRHDGGTWVVTAALLLLLAPALASANAGYPMIVVIWPASFLLLIPIILIEALIGRRQAEGAMRCGGPGSGICSRTC